MKSGNSGTGFRMMEAGVAGAALLLLSSVPARLQGGGGVPLAFAFPVDGKSVAAVRGDGTLAGWEVAARGVRPRAARTLDAGISAAAVDGPGRQLATAGMGGIATWSLPG